MSLLYVRDPIQRAAMHAEVATVAIDLPPLTGLPEQTWVARVGTGAPAMDYRDGRTLATIHGVQHEEPNRPIAYGWVVTVWDGSNPITPPGGIYFAELSDAMATGVAR